VTNRRAIASQVWGGGGPSAKEPSVQGTGESVCQGTGGVRGAVVHWSSMGILIVGASSIVGGGSQNPAGKKRTLLGPHTEIMTKHK